MSGTTETTVDLASLTAPRQIHWWGHDYTITPALVDEVLGDGKRVIAFQPLATRPNYYVVRVDSSWCLDGEDGDDSIFEHTDDIYDAIEEQYGRSHYEPDEDEEEAEDAPFPALDDSYGSSWWSLDGDD